MRRESRLDELHVAECRGERFVVAFVDRVGERPVLRAIPDRARGSGSSPPDDDSTTPSLGQEHRHRRRVLHQRAEASDLVAGDFPAPPLGQVADAEHEVVAQWRADHLDEAPTVGAAQPQLQQRPDLLALNAGERERGELEVVGVDEVEAVLADRLVDRDAEQPLGGPVGPADAGAGVDDEHGVGQRLRDGGQGREVARGRHHPGTQCPPRP